MTKNEICELTRNEFKSDTEKYSLCCDLLCVINSGSDGVISSVCELGGNKVGDLLFFLIN